MTDITFDDMLTFDPLDTAERMTGARYTDDPSTAELGFAMHIMHAQNKRGELALRQDSYYGISMTEFLDIVRGQGFEQVWEQKFKDGVETRYIFWKNGLLLYTESYTSGEKTTVSNAKMYLNVEFPWKDRTPWRMPLSGHLNGPAYDDEQRYIWVGDIDVREAFVHHLAKIETFGKPLPVWVERPFLWLITHEQTRDEDYDFKALNAEVIDALPAHVREVLGPEDED